MAWRYIGHGVNVQRGQAGECKENRKRVELTEKKREEMEEEKEEEKDDEKEEKLQMEEM